MNALWKVGEFRSGDTIELCLATADKIEAYEKHHSFVRWVYTHVEIGAKDFPQGCYGQPDGSNVIGWKISEEDVRAMGMSAFCLPREITEELHRLRDVLKDADRFRKIAGRWGHVKTSASERFLAELNIEADVTLSLAEIIDANGCNAKLAPGQYWSFCGETDMGQTLPVLCERCTPGGLKRA